MPYQTNIPNASQSPGLFPSQGNENFTRLKTIIGANHKFNDSAAADDGYHQNIKMLPIAVPSADATVGQAFANTADATGPLTYIDQANNRYQITPCLPMRAWVIFDGSGNILNSGNAKFNVTNIIVQGTGIYKINFTTAFPSIYYNWTGNVVTTNGAAGSILTSRSSSSYGEYITTTDIQLRVLNVDGANSGTFQAVTVMFFGG